MTARASLVLIALLGACSTPQSVDERPREREVARAAQVARAARLAGQVVDEVGAPIAEAVVTAGHDGRGTTDVLGHFVITTLVPGERYQLSLDSVPFGFWLPPAPCELVAPEEGIATVTLRFSRNAGSLAVQFTTRRYPSLLGSLEVFEDNDWKPTTLRESPSPNALAIEYLHLPPGTYRFTPIANGYRKTPSEPVRVKRGERAQLTVDVRD